MPKTTFAEQVNGLTVRYPRRTPALQAVATAVGVALAGKAGSRLLHHLHQALSWATLLNCVMRVPDPPLPRLSVLAVDDFALRRSRRYGTLVVDAERRLPVDVWDTRDAELLATWLRAHPGIEVVCRDGSQTYRAAIRGAPEAIQVADRFQCAMRRLVVSPTQSGGIWREILGSDGLPNPETVMGTRACQEIDDRAQVSGTGYRGTRVTW